ncbi:MAG: peptidase T [Spirochaetia bacterium]
MSNTNTFFKEEILDRFLRYVRIDTTSDRHIDKIPSTPGQIKMADLLTAELAELGVTDVYRDDHQYIIARIPPRHIETDKYIGFMAHMDTSEDVSGKNVQPVVRNEYNGEDIELESGVVITTQESPELLRYTGKTIITSSGTTLLGGDDKAGISEIMAVIKYLKENPEVPHCGLEIIFTPDEETGKGMDFFPVKELKSKCCYTLDGDSEGIVEAECFSAYKVDVLFSGRVIHLGSARGVLVNPVVLMGKFITMLPQNESPEATDGRYGYYCPLEAKSTLEKAHIELYLRDFETQEVERRVEVVRQIAETVSAMYPGSQVEVSPQKQYLNMLDHFDKDKRILSFLKEAISETGIEPEMKSIRGGTDGARLSEMGIPTPNVSNGSYNYHSLKEWAALPAMVRAANVMLGTIQRWTAVS